MSSVTKRKAYSYIRMSTEAQLAGHSLPRQLELAQKYVIKHNLQLVEDFRDIGISAFKGKNVKNGTFGIFIKALEQNKIEKGSVLLIESLDRMSRMEPVDAYAVFNKIVSYDVEIHTLADGQVYSRETMRTNPGQIHGSIAIMQRANSESEEKARRLQKVWTAKRDNIDKKILTSVAPAWLQPKADKSGFEIKLQEAKVIKKIFDLCIDENRGAYSIARYLNKNIDKFPKFTLPKKINRLADGKSRTGWQQSYITKILNNPAVHGEFQPHSMLGGKRNPTQDVYTNYFPPVISKQRFHAAQLKIKGRGTEKSGRKGEGLNNLFTKLISCGRCGATVHFIDKGLPPKGGKYLRCSNANSKHKCMQRAWRYDDFESAFFTFIQDINLDHLFNDSTSQPQTLTSDLHAIQFELNEKKLAAAKVIELQLKLPNADQGIVVEKLSSLSQEIRVLEAKIEEVEQKISELALRKSKLDKGALVKQISLVSSSLKSDDLAIIRRKINAEISMLVKGIKLYNTSEVFLPFEVPLNMSQSSWKHLENQNVFSSAEKAGVRNRKVVTYFDHKDGGATFDRMERYFVVRFANHIEKQVYPIKQSVSNFDHTKFAKFKKKIQLKEELAVLNKIVVNVPKKLKKKSPVKPKLGPKSKASIYTVKAKVAPKSDTSS